MRYRPSYTWKPIDPAEIPKESRGGAPSRYLPMLASFIKSGETAAEVDTSGYSNPSSAAASLRGLIQSRNLSRHVRVISRRRRVFLVKVTP